jgi:hypothetical protein
MLRMGISLLLLVSTIDARVAAQADVDRRLPLAKQILEISITSAAFELIQKTLFESSAGYLSGQLTQSQLAEALKRQPTAEDMKKLNEAVRATMARVFSREAFVEALAPVYAKYLTFEDLTQIATFMKTPPGQRLLQMQGQLMADGGGLLEQMMERRRGGFQETLIEELRKAFPEAR